MPFSPIWKDRFVTLAAGEDSADFEIRLDTVSGELIFSGRAYRRPGAEDVVARINDICADYLRNPLPALAAGLTPLLSAATFVTVVAGSAVDTVTFWDDWSYDPDFDPDTDPLADPVNGVLDPRQWFMYTILDGSVTARLAFADGTTQDVPLTVVRAGSFNLSFNASYDVGDAGTGSSGTAVLDLRDYPGLETITVGGITYTVRPDGCARYAVYYVNAHGGWDSLLLDGYSSRRDELTRHTSLNDYDNNDPLARGRRDYAIEVTPAWTLRTGILTDAQSARMHHLLNSPQVYLCDLALDRFFPVVLTDDSHDRQSYKGNGRRPSQYNFNAQLAQERFRR